MNNVVDRFQFSFGRDSRRTTRESRDRESGNDHYCCTLDAIETRFDAILRLFRTLNRSGKDIFCIDEDGRIFDDGNLKIVEGD